MKKKVLTLISLIITISLAACATGVADTQTQAVTSGTVSESTTDLTSTETESSLVLEVLTHITAELDPQDTTWNEADMIPITLDGTAILSENASVQVQGSTATITDAGTYALTGTLTNGQIIVDTQEDGMVRLVLDSAAIHNATGPAILVENAEQVMLVLADATENSLSDGTERVTAAVEEDGPNATVYSKADLILYGNGTLIVNGNYQDGITSKDNLLITGGTYIVTAVDDGIRGKDSLQVLDGHITVQAGGDGLKSDTEEDVTLGYIQVENGQITVIANGDAITAQSDVIIAGGEFNLSSGGGNQALLTDDTSAKGIKAVNTITITGGTFQVDSADDAVHANNSILVTDGSFTITTGDDGFHADAVLQIDGGTIAIEESYEGLESAVIMINGGDIHLVASDDGINVSGGNDGSGMMNPAMGHGTRPEPGQRPANGFAQPGTADTFEYDGDYYLYIHGGYIVVNADGDGVDVNGAVEMTAGTVIVNGPTDPRNGAIDYDATFTLSGGAVIAAGSAGMAQSAGNVSSQYSILINFEQAIPAGTLIHIQDGQENDILTYSPAKLYQSIAFTSPALVRGETYTIFIGGTASGTVTDGLYQVDTYTPGDEYTTLTLSEMITTIGIQGGFRP